MTDKSPAITMLRWLGKVLPGDFVRTTFYLYAISKPRKWIRTATSGFYRMDHIYDVIYEASKKYRGNFSILEFGTNEGYSFTKILYATKYAKMADRITVHAFDSFEGMPAAVERSDTNIITNSVEWIEGQFHGNYEELAEYCGKKYRNYEIHKGFFEDTITEKFLERMTESPPILIWIDCDYYSSAKTVLERLIPHIPSGCVIYFDEYEWNYGSRFTGEARLVHEVNMGLFERNIELVLDTKLSWDSKRVYRFMRFEGGPYYEIAAPAIPDPSLHRTNDSPLP